MSKIAFFGLGNMGGSMAVNLLKAGHDVCAFDLVPENVRVLTDAGATTATTPADVVGGVDCVISMLPAGKHVEGLYLGNESEQGLLEHMSVSTLILDSGTIDAATARKVGEAASAKGIAMMDAPVSGGVAAAAAGTLAFMCGGSKEAFVRAEPILQGMGTRIFHAGGHGAGQVAKICNNMLLSVLMIATSEALQLGVDNGLDPNKLSEIMLASSGRNWCLELYNPYPGVMENAPASNAYRPGFMVDLMCKDLGLAMETASVTDSSTPMGALANSIYQQHQASGNGQLDFSSVLHALKTV